RERERCWMENRNQVLTTHTTEDALGADGVRSEESDCLYCSSCPGHGGKLAGLTASTAVASPSLEESHRTKAKTELGQLYEEVAPTSDLRDLDAEESDPENGTCG